MKSEQGLAVVISGPSGAGKSTVTRRLIERFGYELSVSVTTRAPRSGETDGVEYHFTDRKTFLQRVARGSFLEHSEHFDNLYGTPREPVEQALKDGRVILLEIDVNGARQVMEALRGRPLCSIFLSAPDAQEQERRLRGRLSECEASIRTRLQRAELEIAEGLQYDHRVLNDDVERTVEAIHGYIEAMRECGACERRQ